MRLPFVEQATNNEFWPVIADRRVKPFPTNEAAWRWLDQHTDAGRADTDRYNANRIAFSMCGAQNNSAPLARNHRRVLSGITRSQNVMDEHTNSENLPAVVGADGFDGGDDDSDRLIRGPITGCVDGVWSAKDGSALPRPVIAVATKEVVQCWKGGMPTQTITTLPLPDVNELNAKVPKESWEEGLDGAPRPPWVRQYLVYLLDPQTAGVFTYINGTTGARIAVRELRDKVQMMRALRCAHVVPLVELSAKPMKTRFGTKQRPFFKIIDWRILGANPQITTASTAAIEHVGASVKPVGTKEAFSDEIPW
jgi:hypothetical protein